MADPRRGDVVLVHFPFTDLRSTKLRPAIALAIHGEDLVVVGVFSNISPSPKACWLLIQEGQPAFHRTGLKKTSVVKGEKVAVLHRSIVHSLIGSLHPSLLQAVVERVKAALQL